VHGGRRWAGQRWRPCPPVCEHVGVPVVWPRRRLAWDAPYDDGSDKATKVKVQGGEVRHGRHGGEY
jgi:hypothetical protein